MRRFLDALKAETFPREVFPAFMEAFTSLVKCNLTAEVLRSLSLFITYAYHKPASSASRTPRGQYGTLRSRSGTVLKGQKRPTLATFSDGKDAVSTTSMSKGELGTKILEMYADLLCENSSSSNLKKFARTVTNKVSPAHVNALPALSNFHSGFSIFCQKMTQRSSFSGLKFWLDSSLSMVQAMPPNLQAKPAASPSCDRD